MILIFPLCVLLVYLVLAAQYESWTLPLSVILIVPMTLLSRDRRRVADRRRQQHLHPDRLPGAGGLACKNAILIVEFARQREHEGRAPRRRRCSRPAACGCGRS